MYAVEIMAIGIEPSAKIHFFPIGGFGGFYRYEISLDHNAFVFHCTEVFAPHFG